MLLATTAACAAPDIEAPLASQPRVARRKQGSVVRPRRLAQPEGARWRLSNTMDAEFCVAALKEALARFGKPETFSTDQGSQFTSADFTDVLRGAEVRISMVVRERGVCRRRGRRAIWTSTRNVLRKRVRDHEADSGSAFPGHGVMKPEQQEIERLRRELARMKAERDILRKAAA